MPPFSPARAAIILSALAAALVGMTARVAWLQTYGRRETIRRADRQQHVAETTLARRGSIFDRNGTPMVLTVQKTACFLDPRFLLQSSRRDGGDLQHVLDRLQHLAALIGIDPDELTSILDRRPESRYIRIAEGLDDRAAAEVQRLNIPGVGLEPMSIRYYPLGSSAAHILGAVRKDGTGLEGLELKYQAQLAGRNGWKRVEKDARRRPISIDAEDFVPPVHGRHLVLTIDTNIQMIAEQELAAACSHFRAKRGEVIVIDPNTGDLLAMANWPAFNPQNLGDSRMEDRRNRCLTDPFEPGSTLKPFIMGPAIAWSFTRAAEVWPIRAQTHIIDYPRGSRRVSDVSHHGPLTSWDVLVKSSNIGMALLANRMGNANLHKALATFEFGRKTGIELGGENPGLLQPLPRWTRYSTESIAQGYEIMLTPLQLARGFCAFANGGRLVRPRIVQGWLDADGGIVPHHADADSLVPQIIDPAAAATVRRMLADVLVRGTATRARSPHWNFFGKTATAHISQGKSGYAPDRYTSSFLAGAPLENPRIVAIFIVHEPDPKIAKYGGTVSAPSAGRMMERILAYLRIPPSPPLTPPPADVASALHQFDPRRYASPLAATP